MSFNQNVLIAVLFAIIVGLLLGTKMGMFISKLFYGRQRYRDHYGNYGFSSKSNWGNKGFQQEKSNNNSGFGFILYLFVGFLMFFLAKSTNAQLYPQSTSPDSLHNISDVPAETHKTTAATTVPHKEVPPPIAAAPQKTEIIQQEAPQPQELFILKFGAFRYITGAEQLMESLQQQAVKARYTTKNVNGEKLYVVFAGPFNSKQRAESLKKEINDQEAIVTPYPYQL